MPATPIAIPRSNVNQDFQGLESQSPPLQFPKSLARIEASESRFAPAVGSPNFAAALGPSPRVRYTQTEHIREAAPRTNRFRVYEPIDFTQAIAKQVGRYEFTYKCSPNQLRDCIPEALQVENQRIALQSALLDIFIQNPTTEIGELNFDKIGMTPEFFNDLTRIQALCRSEHFAVDPESLRYVTKSGLKVKPVKDWNCMSLDKHMLMRISPLYRFQHNDKQIVGKIYADYLDIGNSASRRTMAEAVRQDNNEARQEMIDGLGGVLDMPCVEHEMHFGHQKHVFQHALNALIRDANPAANLERVGEIETPIRPAIVEWADDSKSEDYVSQVRFNDQGGLEIVLPPVVIAQYEGDIPEGPQTEAGKPHLLVFVQDLEGSVKTTRHKDTHFHHSTPNGGRPVRTAGELFGHFEFENKGLVSEKVIFQVDKICNESGHYWPKIATLGNFRDDLIASGLDATQLEFAAVSLDPEVLASVKTWQQNNNPSMLPAQSINSAKTNLITDMTRMLREQRGPWEL